MDAESPSAWVLAAEELRPVKRAWHAARQLEPKRSVELGEHAVCVEFDEPPPARRVERRLGHPIEARLDCDVARYPAGRGYYVLFVARSSVDDGLDPVLDELGLAWRVVERPSVLTEPLRVCAPVAAVVDLPAFTGAIEAAGLPISAVYEVGACSR